MRVPTAGAKGGFTSIEHSILINLFAANIIESSRGPLASPLHPTTQLRLTALPSPSWVSIREETKENHIDSMSGDVGLQKSLFISITELLLTWKAPS